MLAQYKLAADHAWHSFWSVLYDNPYTLTVVKITVFSLTRITVLEYREINVEPRLTKAINLQDQRINMVIAPSIPKFIRVEGTWYVAQICIWKANNMSSHKTH